MGAFIYIVAAANLTWAMIAIADWLAGNPPDKADRWMGISGAVCSAMFLYALAGAI